MATGIELARRGGWVLATCGQNSVGLEPAAGSADAAVLGRDVAAGRAERGRGHVRGRELGRVWRCGRVRRCRWFSAAMLPLAGPSAAEDTFAAENSGGLALRPGPPMPLFSAAMLPLAGLSAAEDTFAAENSGTGWPCGRVSRRGAAPPSPTSPGRPSWSAPPLTPRRPSPRGCPGARCTATTPAAGRGPRRAAPSRRPRPAGSSRTAGGPAARSRPASSNAAALAASASFSSVRSSSRREASESPERCPSHVRVGSTRKRMRARATTTTSVTQTPKSTGWRARAPPFGSSVRGAGVLRRRRRRFDLRLCLRPSASTGAVAAAGAISRAHRGRGPGRRGPGRPRPRRGRPRCAGAGCTWPRGRSGQGRRS